MKDDARAVRLAHTIVEDAVNRIAEEFTDRGTQNAATLTVFGYLGGITNRIMMTPGLDKPSALHMMRTAGNLAKNHHHEIEKVLAILERLPE